jgi:hypothetical protein
MDEKDFKKHLADLVHGHHHPDEHDWQAGNNSPKIRAQVRGKGGKTVKSASRRPKRRAK